MQGKNRSSLWRFMLAFLVTEAAWAAAWAAIDLMGG